MSLSLDSGTVERSIDRLVAGFQSSPSDLARALQAMVRNEAAVLPLLGAEQQAHFLAACEALSYRPGTPVLGGPGREVYQDFELSARIAADSPLHDLGRALERWLASGLNSLSDPPLAGAVPFNDLIVQRYAVGSRGITPHRDHITYRDIVALVTLSGRAGFFVCSDRSGRNPRPFPMAPGNLILLRAPGFAGREDRPFHFLCDVTEARVGLGYRHEVPRPKD